MCLSAKGHGRNVMASSVGKGVMGCGHRSLYEWLETNVAKSFGERIVWSIMHVVLTPKSLPVFSPLDRRESCMVHHNEMFVYHQLF